MILSHCKHGSAIKNILIFCQILPPNSLADTKPVPDRGHVVCHGRHYCPDLVGCQREEAERTRNVFSLSDISQVLMYSSLQIKGTAWFSVFYRYSSNVQ
jgi:hypothetical protein